MGHNFKAGDRVRLTRDFPDTAIVHPVNLDKGDEGRVMGTPNGDLGFCADRWGDIISFTRFLEGNVYDVLDFCELVQPSPAVEISAIPSSARYWGACGQCGKQAELGETGLCPACLDKLVAPKAIYDPTWINPLFCYNCSKHGVDPETWECSECGANFADIGPEIETEDGAERLPEAPLEEVIADLRARLEKANEIIDEQHGLLAQQHKLFMQQHKMIVAQGAQLEMPVRYEIKTLLQDLEDTNAGDFLLSQALNEGWEILELSHHVVDELDGETIIREFRRVVTLRRPEISYPPVDMGHKQFNLGEFSPIHSADSMIYGEETDGDNG